MEDLQRLAQSATPKEPQRQLGRQAFALISLASSLFTALLILAGRPTSATAQIQPANDTNTIVKPNGNTFDITGGQKAGVNLFHGFEKFGLSDQQTANFIGQPGIKNILGRVTGGDASIVNGLIKVTGGNANLYLMNPAGILFGANARLDVPGAFTATTASGIGIGNQWFKAIGTNDYASLVANPSGFAFTGQSGAIVNAGSLAVGSGQNLTLLGRTVISTGTIDAPGGKITIAAVQGDKLVRISEEGHLLNLELPLEAKAAISPQAFTPLSLSQLLTAGDPSQATGITIENGVIKLSNLSATIPNTAGTTVVSNQVNVSGATGGTVHVLGDKVGLVGAKIDASGTQGGGTVLVGGDYKGQGTVPNASQTFVNRESTISADAIDTGSGGRVIVWADRTTRFLGEISARGGTQSGNGGFVEVSGKQNLAFDGVVHMQAPNGQFGTLLFDPSNVIISNPAPHADDLRFVTTPSGDAEILAESFSFPFRISPNRITELLRTGNVSIAAQSNIQVNDPINASANTRASTLTLIAPTLDIYSIISNGGITLNGSTVIRLFKDLKSNGGDITLNGPVIISSSVTSSIDASGAGSGNVTFTSTINSAVASSSADLDIKARGDVTIRGAIGNTNPLGTLRIENFQAEGKSVSFGDINGEFVDVASAGNVTVNAIGNLAVSQHILTENGTIQLTAKGDISLSNYSYLQAGMGVGTGDINLIAGGNLKLAGGRFLNLKSSRNVSLQGQSIAVTDGTVRAGFGGTLKAQATSGTLEIKDTTLEAGGEIRLEALQGNLTLNNVPMRGIFYAPTPQDIILNAQSLNIQGNSQLQANRDLKAQIQGDLTVENSQLQAYQDLTLQTSTNLTAKGSQISAGRDLKLLAQGTAGQVRVEDTTKPSLIRATNNVTLQGDQGIEINALGRPQSVFESGALTLTPTGGNISLISNGQVTGNGRFISKGNFSVLTTSNTPGKFLYTPINAPGIISSAGDINFGDYSGTSLKVEAGGNINGGNIEITGANTTLSGTDSDVAILSSAPSLILRAGLTKLRQTPDVLPSITELRNTPSVPSSQIEGTSFTTTEKASNSARINVGNIRIATTLNKTGAVVSTNGSDAVILTAPSNIKTGAINTNGGSVALSSAVGNITVDTINAANNSGGLQNGGSVDIFAPKGLFRAVSSFDFKFQGASNSNISVPTTILTSTRAGTLSLNGKSLQGEIRIRQGGARFIENYNYPPRALSETEGGTSGQILIASGTNASLDSDYRTRIFTDSFGTYKLLSQSEPTPFPPDHTLPQSARQTVQKQLNAQTNSSACNPSNTIAIASQSTETRTRDRGSIASQDASKVQNPCNLTNMAHIKKLLHVSPNSNQSKSLNLEKSQPKVINSAISN